MPKPVFQCAHALVVLSLLGLVGCYAKVEVGDGPTGEAESGVIVKQTKKDLPPCNMSRSVNHGTVYYVSDSGKFFYCDGDRGRYVRLDLVGQDGSSCTVTQDNGSATISCEDGTDATVSDGQDGADGAPGADGQDGTSCTVVDNLDGTKTISCTDGTSVTVSDGAQGPPGADGAPGADGQDGTSCTVIDNLDGTKTISCTDGTSVTVSDGQDGANGTSCTVVDNLDGTYDITCGDNTVTVTDDSCTVVTNGCIATVSCDDGTFATVQLAAMCVFACTEQGIRDAIAEGGGPHTFACNGPTTVTTEAEIIIDNDVILDGEGNLIVRAQDNLPYPGRRVLSIEPNTTVELIGISIAGGDLFGSPDTTPALGGGGILNEGTLVLTECSILDNFATYVHDLDGGGIYNAGDLTVVRSVVADNVGSIGGGVFNTGSAAIIESVIEDNRAYTTGGIRSTGVLTLVGTTVSNNWGSGSSGGGINSYGSLTMISSTVSNNRGDAGDDGVITHGTASIVNSTISGNGGIYAAGAFGTYGELFVVNSTIIGSGVPMWSTYDAQVYVANTLIADTKPCDPDSGGCGHGTCLTPDTITSLGGNIESPSDRCNFVHPTDLVNVSLEDLAIGPLQDNGGPVETHALLPGSVAIDRVPMSMCLDMNEQWLATDGRGVARPQGGACDVGAFEVQP